MLKKLSLAVCFASLGASASAAVYDFPVTVQGYEGEKTSSVSYTGQIARHALHNSLKKLVSKSDGLNAFETLAQFELYAVASEGERAIIDPASKEGFAIKQTTIDEISKDKNLLGKAFKGAIQGWPGFLNGDEVLTFLLNKASQTDNGYDPVNGYDYTQLVSKYVMGAVFYNQAVDQYLDEKLQGALASYGTAAKDGAAYSNAEHYWDEAFGYFGAPAHTLELTAKDVYNIYKQDAAAFAKADKNGDGVVDLKSEMAFAHAYYAASYDLTGRTNYLHTIFQAFYDGRKVFADAQGKALTDEQIAEINAQVATIGATWQTLNAESVFKYAGKVYSDLQKLTIIVEANGDPAEVYRDYVKHWGELKGFALALEANGKGLGEAGVTLNRLIGFSPVLFGDTQVKGVDADGEYQQRNSETLEGYALHMLKVQQLMIDEFGVVAREADATASLQSLSDKLSTGVSNEND